ncbi:MAG: pirin family protein [Saprospiraceae bacterium]|nr:pirin family protein [Saprospiraceae bacterium]
MSNKHLIIEERSRDIGDFIVGRLLPFRKKRMIGPFTFVDHMGPIQLKEGRSMEVDQHPHIGLATLTYLLKGEIMHADSIGTHQRIRPNEVNLMIAGSGVTHTERSPTELLGQAYDLEGYQIWIALPKEQEDQAPSFHHLKSDEIPTWTAGDLQYKLIAGKAFGRKSKLELWSDLFFVELTCSTAQKVDLSQALQGEIGILVNQGKITACSEEIGAGNLLVAKDENQCSIDLAANSRVFLLGGLPFPERRYIDWNFVSSDLAKIRQAKRDWAAKEFPQVPNDESYIPHPTFKG